MGRRLKIANPLPDSPESWLEEIAEAYADAYETIPFGPLVGQEIGPDDLFHLGPAVCLKFRGIKTTKKILDQATTAALSSYLATKDQCEETVSVPEMAFAISYLASHFGLEILDADTITGIMEHLEDDQQLLLELVREMGAGEGPYGDKQAQRIEAVLGRDRDVTFDEGVGIFFEHLRANLPLPCEVTGTEDFRWEEPYILGVYDPAEYKRLRKTQPSYQDTYELLSIEQGTASQWMLSAGEDIGAHVRRLSDGREFLLGLSELEATEKRSASHPLLYDYSVWFVNSR